MTARILHPGDVVTLTLPGDQREQAAPLLRILDRRGRRVNCIDLADLPPYTMLVVRVDGMERAVPLWHVDGEYFQLTTERRAEADDEETGFAWLDGATEWRRAG